MADLSMLTVKISARQRQRWALNAALFLLALAAWAERIIWVSWLLAAAAIRVIKLYRIEFRMMNGGRWRELGWLRMALSWDSSTGRVLAL